MASDQGSSGCSLIIFIIAVISIAYNHFVTTPNKNAIKLEQKIAFWGDSTIKYFDSFDCENLKESEIQTKITSFFVLFSGQNGKCKIKEHIIENFETNSKLNQYFSRDIDKANVIVWIAFKSGNVESQYSNGVSAIRNEIEVKFINKESKAIFRTEVFKSIGTPSRTIKRKRGDKKPVHFGRIPYDEIIDFIYSEMIKK